MDYRPDKVILTLPLISILDDKVKEELTNIFGEQVLHIEHNKVLTLAFALTEGVVSNERLRYTLNLHKYDITQMLKELCVDGYLISDGIGRGTTYHLNTGQNLNSSSDNLNSNLNSSDSNLNSSAEDNLKTYQGSKKVKRRCGKQELFDMIRDCTEDWKSVDEISNEIKRSPQYLKGEIIPIMIESGLLEREHIMPNHPAQRIVCYQH